MQLYKETAINKFRVIFITHYAELFGANKSLLSLLDGFLSAGFTDLLLIIPADGDIVFELQKRGIAFRIIKFANEIYFNNNNPFLVKKALCTLYNFLKVIVHARTFKKNKYTIIHTNSSATLIGAYCAFFLKIPHVWHIREFGYDDYRYKYNFGYKYFQFWINRAEATLAVSNAVYEKRGIHCKSPFKKYIHNGVIFSTELEKNLRIAEKLLPFKTNIIFGSIGLIEYEKNQADAIDAFILIHQKNNNTKLIIAGTGNQEYIRFLKQKAEKNIESENIMFTGFIKDTNSFYDKIDCLLLCSKNGALERVAIEAMSKGIPVIAFDGGGIREIIDPMKDGLLYKNSSKELSEMMQLFLDNNLLVQNLKVNALAKVKKKFTIEKYAQEVLGIYENIQKKYLNA